MRSFHVCYTNGHKTISLCQTDSPEYAVLFMSRMLLIAREQLCFAITDASFAPFPELSNRAWDLYEQNEAREYIQEALPPASFSPEQVN